MPKSYLVFEASNLPGWRYIAEEGLACKPDGDPE